MEALLLLVQAVAHVAFILIGYKLGQASVGNPEPVEAVEPAPAAPDQDADASLQRRRFEAIMANIDNYDGTDQGQKDH